MVSLIWPVEVRSTLLSRSMPARARNDRPWRSFSSGDEVTGENGCEIDCAGDMLMVMDSPIGVAIGVSIAWPAGWAADWPGCPPGLWRVVCACRAAGSRHAAITGSRGRRECFFIWCFSDGPGAMHDIMVASTVTHGLRADNGSLELVLNKPRHP
jgi:hypothetical protein